jgi:hypothetical protein
MFGCRIEETSKLKRDENSIERSDTMITATSYKKYNNFFLYWNCTSKDEERVLRWLLKGTNTSIRNHHFITKIGINNQTNNQMPIDYWLPLISTTSKKV